MKAVVVFSGGQDSTTCLFEAIRRHGRAEVHALSFDYGQRHATELQAARDIADLARVGHTVLELPFFAEIGASALTDDTIDVDGSGGMEDEHADGGRLPTTFVPGRNMIMLGIGAAFAVSKGATSLWTGVSAEDYSGYPDCRGSFLDAMAHVVAQAMPSSANVHFVAPLLSRSKADTVRMAAELGTDCMDALGLSITCYHGKNPGCGECPSCVLRAKGFEEAGR